MDSVGEGDEVGLGFLEVLGDGVGLEVGAATFVAIPLLHTNFLPDLIHVYFIPLTTFVEP